jgi:hypothetical protein
VSTDLYSSRFQGWLKNVGLNADPFALYEAERELHPTEAGTPILSHLFVNRPYLFHVFGDPPPPRTAFLLAGRGCGKTATREMVAYEGQHGRLRRRVLVVRYTDFQPLLGLVEHEIARIELRHHVQAILRAALQAVVEQLFPHAVRLLSTVERRFLTDYARSFANPVVRAQIAAAVQETEPLLDCAEMHDLELLDTFADLVARMGRAAVYVLVDGIDEFPETANDTEMAAALLRPLVAEKTVLEHERYGFKFFLPVEVGEALRPDVRAALGQMIETRLRYFSDDLVTRLEDLCAPDIRYSVMEELIKAAQGSPRNLLRACTLLLHHHVMNSQSLSIVKSDLAAALYDLERQLDQERRQRVLLAPLSTSASSAAAPPAEGLYIDAHQHVWVDGVELADQPSQLEFNLLEALYQHEGRLVTREQLVQAVWGLAPEGADETNLRKLLSRLRRRLEPGAEGESSRFVHNMRGRGYYLKR